MKFDSITKFVQLIVTTVESPAKRRTMPVPLSRAETAVAARNVVSKPEAVMKPPMTIKTCFNQRSNPGRAEAICAGLLPDKAAQWLVTAAIAIGLATFAV